LLLLLSSVKLENNNKKGVDNESGLTQHATTATSNHDDENFQVGSVNKNSAGWVENKSLFQTNFKSNQS
jgi:hypothetical protein